MCLRGADLDQESPAKASKVQAFPQVKKEMKKVENFTTLKQVCPSEYQGAQGAFKDSMIH
jgi:hypothetical protein